MTEKQTSVAPEQTQSPEKSIFRSVTERLGELPRRIRERIPILRKKNADGEPHQALEEIEQFDQPAEEPGWTPKPMYNEKFENSKIHSQDGNQMIFSENMKQWAETQSNFRTFTKRFAEKLFASHQDNVRREAVVENQDATYTYTFNFPPEMLQATPDPFVYPEAALHIRDPKHFLQTFNSLSRSIAGASNIRNWTHDLTPDDLWCNATEYDFKEPEQFVLREKAIIEDETFDHLGNWQGIGTIPSLNGETISVRHQVPVSEYESPHELQFAFTNPDKESPEQIDQTPVVRYGIFPEGKENGKTEKTAVIYAVQMPFAGQHSEGAAKGEMEETRRGAQIIQEYFLSDWQKNQQKYTELLGEIPPDILQEQDSLQFIHKYFKHLEQHFNVDEQYNGNVFLAIMEVEKKIGHSEEFLPLLREHVMDMADVMEKEQVMQESIDTANQRREVLKKFSEHFRLPNSYGEIRNVAPAALASLTAACEMMHQEGVTKLMVPLYFPIRTHTQFKDQDEAAGHLFDLQVKMFQRLAHEIDGIEVTEIAEDGYMYLTLGKKQGTKIDEETGEPVATWENVPLTSERPIVQEIIDTVHQNYQPKSE